MLTNTIALLLCPAAHEASPLVTVAIRRDGDRLIDAMLGCSVCGAEYAVREGVAWLIAADVAEVPRATYETVDPMRIAALLGLGDSDARVMLCGAYALAAAAVEDMTGARCLVVNASPGPAYGALVDHLVIVNGSVIPLANASLHGLAVDDAHVGLLAHASRVVRVGGRVIGPAHAPVPEGCRLLARDAVEWVAEVDAAASAPVELTRSTPGQSRG